MSLRDQLLKAGLVDRKKHQDVNRELKKRRKDEQGQREKQAVVDAREAAARQAAVEAEIARKREERARRDAEREVQDRRRLVANLIRAYRLRLREGPLPFYHLAPDRRHVHRLRVTESVAWDLRRGALAIAWAGDDPGDPEYIVLPEPAARRIQKHEPARVLFLNDEAPPRGDPSEQLAGVE